MNGIPDRSRISFVTVNWQDRDGPTFVKMVNRVFGRLGLKWSGSYSVSLVGMAHLHTPVLHEGHSREDLIKALRKEFVWARAVVVQEFNVEQSVEDVVKNVVAYGYSQP